MSTGRYGQANISIEQVSIDTSDFGDRVEAEVSVTVRDTSNSAGTSGYNQFFVLVEAEGVSDHIIMHCGVIQPGNTFVVEDSSGSDEGKDGEFTVPSSQTRVTVYAGGKVAGVQCNTRNFGVNKANDIAEKTIKIREGGGSEPLDAQVLSVATDKSEYRVGDTVTISAVVENTGGPGTADVRAGLKETGQTEPNVETGTAVGFDGSGTQTAQIPIKVPTAGPAFDEAVAYVRGNLNNAKTTPITIKPKDGSLKDNINVTIEEIRTGKQSAEVVYSVENVGSILHNVTVTFSPGNGTRQIQISPGDKRGFTRQYSFNNQNDMRQEFCVEIGSVEIP